MAKKKTVDEAPASDVTVHLDKDLNDPRLVPPADKLPSLNDADQNE